MVQNVNWVEKIGIHLNGTTAEKANKNIQGVIDECKKQGVTDKAQIAYILATMEWETAHTFRPVEEAFWLSDEWRYKHLRYAPYWGRAYVQITWEANYERFGRLLGVDLLKHPDLALYPPYAAFILVYGMKYGSFTGKRLADYIYNGHNDFVGARKIINGTDKAHTIASIAKEYLEKL